MKHKPQTNRERIVGAVRRVTDFDTLPVMLTPAELAAVTPLGSGAIGRLIRSGRIPSTRLGRRIFISKEVLRELLTPPKKAPRSKSAA